MNSRGAGPGEDGHQEERGFPFLGLLFCLLLPLGTIAGIVDFFFYWAFLSERGIALWSTESMVQWQYLTTTAGMVLTIVGGVPWLMVLGWLLWPRRADE